MAREIVDGIHWIQQCVDHPVGPGTDRPLRDWHHGTTTVHRCMNAFLVRGERSLLFDTHAPLDDTQILRELDTLLGDDGLDYLALSHPETPHAGNTFAILDAYPDATVVAPDFGAKHELYHLRDSRLVAEGETLDLGGRVVEFVHPTFIDHGIHTWLYAPDGDVLFTVDYMGCHHHTDECERFVDELADPVGMERLKDFHQSPMFWAKYADPAKTHAAIDELTAAHGDSTLAPAHGMIFREDAAHYMELTKPVIEAFVEPLEGGSEA